MISIDDKNYELIENYRDCFDLEEFKSFFTDYFYDFDYIVGDYSYSRLRLKGFYNSDNKKCKKINNFLYKDKYINEKCAYKCRYFVLKKI